MDNRKKHQRIVIKSNAHAGKYFEKEIFDYFKNKGLVYESEYELSLGISSKKTHRFDLGNKSTLIECKSHKWTETDGIPYAKIRAWNEAMFYFYISPQQYKKYFVVLMDYSQKRCKSLAEYYIEKHQNLIPKDVVIYEYYEERKQCEIYKYDKVQEKHILQHL